MGRRVDVQMKGDPGRCKAQTKKGARCQKMSVLGDFCVYHHLNGNPKQSELLERKKNQLNYYLKRVETLKEQIEELKNDEIVLEDN